MCLAAKELACAGVADEFSGVDDGAAAREDRFWRSFYLDALEHRVIDAHVVCFCADDLFLVRIKDYEVGVGTNRNGSFARVKAE